MYTNPIIMKKKNKLDVQGTAITLLNEENGEYVSLTDMLRAKDGDFFISDWLRNRNTVEFLGVWESVNNPNFNYGEFAIIKSQAGLNSYKLSVKDWVAKTNAVGLRAKSGRYGGTYAQIDIAFEFGMWISAEFKVYLIQEYKRLKSEEYKKLEQNWGFSRLLAKINYSIHTDAIKEKLIPKKLSVDKTTFIYATEADILNVALFGITASEWRSKNVSEKGNIRDFASIEQLVVLSNLESLNAVFIRQGLSQSERLIQLNQIAISQMKSLLKHNTLKELSE